MAAAWHRRVPKTSIFYMIIFILSNQTQILPFKIIIHYPLLMLITTSIYFITDVVGCSVTSCKHWDTPARPKSSQFTGVRCAHISRSLGRLTFKKGCMYPFKYAWCSWVYCVLCIHDHAYNCISCKFTIWLYGTNLFILHGLCWPMVFFHCRFWFGFLGSFLQGGTSLSTSCPGCLPLPCHLGKQRFSLHSGHLCCCCVAANFDWGIPGYKTGMFLMIIIRPVTSEDIIMWTKYWWTKSPLHWLCGGDDTGFS